MIDITELAAIERGIIAFPFVDIEPEVGDVWHTRCGTVAIVKKMASIPGGGFDCEIVETPPGCPGAAGDRFYVDTGGTYLQMETIGHPLDLVERVD